MAGYRFTEASRRDFFAVIADLIDVAGPTVARDYKRRFTKVFASLGAVPGIGHSRGDLTKCPYLFFTVRPYLIVYEEASPSIIIHAVVHGARDVKRVLSARRS